MCGCGIAWLGCRRTQVEVTEAHGDCAGSCSHRTFLGIWKKAASSRMKGWTHICVCARPRACVHVVWIHVYGCMHVEARGWLWVSSKVTLDLIFWDRLFHWTSMLAILVRLAGHQTWRILFHLHFLSPRITGGCCCTWPLYGCWESNSGFCACKTRRQALYQLSHLFILWAHVLTGEFESQTSELHLDQL